MYKNSKLNTIKEIYAMQAKLFLNIFTFLIQFYHPIQEERLIHFFNKNYNKKYKALPK